MNKNKSKINEPRKHHYVPQFYIKNFSDKNSKELYILRKCEYKLNGIAKTKLEVKTATPAQICYKELLYILNINRFKKLEKFNEIEEYFSQLENDFKLLIDRLENLVIENQNTINEIIDESYSQQLLKFFVSFMYWRNPFNFESANLFYPKTLQLFDDSSSEQKELLNGDRKFVKFIFKRIKKSKMRKKESFERLCQYILFPIITFNLFSSNRVRLIYNKDFNFISNDNPVCILGKLEDGFKFERLLMPLTKDLLLVSEDLESENFDSERVNNLMFKNSQALVYGKNKEILNSMKNRY